MDAIKLVEKCYKRLPYNMRSKPWEYTGHGRKVLNTEEELDAYLAAYGEIHILKCRAAFQNFPFDDACDKSSYSIFDWGCGQGLATLTLLDMLYERGLLAGLKKITLIEPSLPALKRAISWVKKFAGPGVTVQEVNKFIPSCDIEDLNEILCESKNSINLFSNILDIRTLSLSWLARKTSSLAEKNYMICVGPKFCQRTNTRIVDFCGYFQPKEFFSAIDAFPYAYTSKTHHPFGCETRCFVHQRNNHLNDSYKEHADSVIFTDDYDYAANCMKGVVSDSLIHLYNLVRLKCSQSYDIFFCPSINTEKVDIVLASVDKGIVLLNVCENIDKLDYEYNRLENIKSNIFGCHLKTIKIDSVINKSVFNCIKTSLYFPYASTSDVKTKIDALNKEKNEEAEEKDVNHKNKDYYAYSILITEDNNSIEELNKVKSKAFKFDYYEELVKIIVGTWHSYKDGVPNFKLTDKQKDIVHDQRERARYKGVAGCGKTQVVANRAVERFLKTGKKVLVITFNISLIQYIWMRIRQVPADFPTNFFEVVNYHQFFRSKANLYSGKKMSLSDWNDKDFFKEYADKITRYDTIIIDEVQDFKESWLYSIVTYFLTKGGTFSVFGDGEQNIYNREMDKETKMPSMRDMGYKNVPWRKISERISMRIQNPQIAVLASTFAHDFISTEMEPITLQDDLFNDYVIKYWNIGVGKTANSLAKNINWLCGNFKLKEKDTVVMAESIDLLRDIVYNYEQESHKKVIINFETKQQYDEVKKNTSPMFLKKDLDAIRRAAKTHFTTYCDELKASTVHSFKGWEANSVILFIQPQNEGNEKLENYGIIELENTPALIYTALTRARCNLFIINLGNQKYDEFFKRNIRN